MKKVLLASVRAALCAGLVLAAGLAHAENVTGRAVIENGNVEKARQEAKNDAMRSYVESKIGVKVQSESEMINYQVVRDYVVSKSEGYVVVKRVVSEKQQAGFLVLVLDLEAGSKPIVVGDIKAQLMALDEDSSRSVLDVAIVSDNPEHGVNWSNYLTGQLRIQGFRANRNDAVVTFLGQNQGMNDFELNARIRQEGRKERNDANSIVRGRVEVLRRAEPVGQGQYRAAATFNGEIIGYESNAVDPVSYTAAAMGSSAPEAENNACELAIREGAAILAQHASVTVQQETRGGSMNIKTVLTFTGIVAPAEERVTILNAIQNAHCRVVRSAFEGGNVFRVFVTTSSYANQDELVSKIIELLQPAYPRAFNEVDASVGSVKHILRLRG